MYESRRLPGAECISGEFGIQVGCLPVHQRVGGQQQGTPGPPAGGYRASHRRHQK